MSRDGSTGTYSRAVPPYVFDTIIDETAVNSEMDDIAAALTQSVSKDGQTTMTGNLKMGGNKLTNAGDASAQNEYTTAGQVQKGTASYLLSIGGTANAITAVAAFSMAAYTAGQQFIFVPTANNSSTTPTININTIGALTITRDASAALVANDIVSGRPAKLYYDGTDMILLNPATVADSQLQVEYLQLTGGTVAGTLTAAQQFILSGVITPAQITANTADYAPTGIATAAVLRLSTDAARNLTGITTGATGRLLVIQNVGSSNLVLVHGSGSSEANRFDLPNGANITLLPTESAVLRYDGTLSRWTCIASTAPTRAASTTNPGAQANSTDTDARAMSATDKTLIPANLAALRYVSPSGTSLTTVAAAGGRNETHSLGAAPLHWGAFLSCTTADAGYSIGDRLWIGPEGAAGSSVPRVATWANATSVGIGLSTSSLQIRSKDGASNVNITNGSWDLFLYASLI